MAEKKEKPVECSNCHGSGTIIVPDENGKKPAVTCGVCDGSGWV